MKRILTFLTALMFLLVMGSPCFAAGQLTTGDQTIYGNKTFEHGITVKGKLTAEGPTVGINATGDVFYVGSTWGHDSPGNYGETPDQPFATIDFAIGQCTADHGDVIYVHSYHAETVTAAITADVAGISIIGITNGRNMPTITTATAIDMLTVTAADVTIANLKFSSPGIDNVTADINIAAARVSVFNTMHLGSETSYNNVSIITITAAGHDFLLDGLRIYNSVVEITGAAIEIEGTAARGEIRYCLVMDTIGLALGAIDDAAAATALYIHHNILKNAKAATAVIDFTNNSTGICSFNHISGRHTTIASNVVTGTSMDFFENRVTEEPVLNGMIMPAADADS